MNELSSAFPLPDRQGGADTIALLLRSTDTVSLRAQGQDRPGEKRKISPSAPMQWQGHRLYGGAWAGQNNSARLPIRRKSGRIAEPR
jgi:hypothetical protein